jgi:pimeloyl-ACP methyl ester carboxylesterase
VSDPQTKKFGPYDLGRTTVYASTQDPRFSYCLYVPPEFQSSSVQPELVAVVHGSLRTFMDFRDQFDDFGTAHNALILCPLFPASVRGDGNADGYKYMSEPGIRYDEVLTSIVDEVSDRYGIGFNRFAMFGFSGGAQFANRFLLLRPERLWAVSLCAPGSVTLLSDKDDWWVGTRNLESRFGAALNNNELSRVPVQMLVGSVDLDTGEITHRVGGRYWMPGANKAGRSRPERLEALRSSLFEAGIHVTHEVLYGIGHDPVPLIARAKQFLALQLAQLRGLAASTS